MPSFGLQWFTLVYISSRVWGSIFSISSIIGLPRCSFFVRLRRLLPGLPHAKDAGRGGHGVVWGNWALGAPCYYYKGFSKRAPRHLGLAGGGDGVRSLGFEGNSTGASMFNSGEVLRPSPMRGVPSNPAAPRVTCRVIGSRAFTRARPQLGLTAFIAACVSRCTAGLVGRTVGVGCVSRARCPHVTIVGKGYVGVVTGL